MVWAAVRTEVPEAEGMLTPEELPDARVAEPVVREALEPELDPVLLLVLLLVVKPLLLLSLELLSLESEALESEESLESLSSPSLESFLIKPHEAQGLLLSLLPLKAEVALP